METPLISHQPENFRSNLNTWNKEVPLEILEKSDWEFCKTGKKEQLNLKNTILNTHLHSSQNIDVEVRQWTGLISLHQTEWLVIYGVGLGYYYLGIQSWLHENRHRRVIFVEDDPGVMRAFLETSVASLLLHDPQAELLYTKTADISSKEMQKLIKDTLFRSLQISSLASYEFRKKNRLEQLRFLIGFYKDIDANLTSEFLIKGQAFFKNYFHNVLQLDQCEDANFFKNVFKGMPAIICGAGPSINKNIDVLKLCKDKAIIFAGGTAMNALNAYNFNPHFGCGVDPFPSHFNRIITNKAFETPYFIRTRMHKDAVQVLHGPKIYLPGAIGYPTSYWVDDKLKYERLEVADGSNVINLSLSVARMLGCNPILFVGLDLAYTDGFSYPPGMSVHGVFDPKEQFKTKGSHEELVLVKDIYDKPIYSLMKWVLESAWYSSFASLHREISLINCTEGGLGFDGVRNMSLKDAMQFYLQKQYDVDGLVNHTLSYAENKHKLNYQEITDVLDEFEKDLKDTEKTFNKIKEEHPSLWSEKLPEESSELEEVENLVKKEDAYQVFLKPFDEAYCRFMGSGVQDKFAPSKIQEFMQGRFPYLAGAVTECLSQLVQAMTESEWMQKFIKKSHPQSVKIDLKPTLYAFENGRCVIKDPNLSIDISENISLEPFDVKVGSGFQETFHEDGSLKHRSYYLEHKLHGPSTYYFNSGKIANQSWYIHGLKQGVMKSFDEEGALLSSRGYIDNLEEGVHLYYYPDGILKSSISYSEGMLDGETVLYYNNGNVRRTLSYQKGKREGADRYYLATGMPLMESEYVDDKPVGVAKMWYLNSQIAKEIRYSSPGVMAEIKRWDMQGTLVRTPASFDYFDLVAQESFQLSDSIKDLTECLQAIYKTLNREMSTEQKKELEGDIKALAEEVSAFDNATKNLKDSLDSEQEAIWKTPANEKNMQDFIKSIAFPMQEAMIKMHWKLKNLIKSLNLKKQSSDDEKKTDNEQKNT